MSTLSSEIILAFISYVFDGFSSRLDSNLLLQYNRGPDLDALQIGAIYTHSFGLWKHEEDYTFRVFLLYNKIHSAQNTQIVDLKIYNKISNEYSSEVFKNNFGWLFASQYNIWKRFDVSLQYRFLKKETDPLRDQKNNFDAILFGIHFFVLNPKIKPL